MQVAVRPHLAAGVALVGASLVAASTISPVPDVHLPAVHLPAVQLATAVNPLEVYAKVLQDALGNVGTLAENAHPGQLLQQFLANQLAAAGTLAGGLQTTAGGVFTALTTQVPPMVQTAVTQLAAGDVAGAVNSLLGIPLAVALPATDLLPALQAILTKPLQNLVNVVNSFTSDPLATELLLSGFIAPLISTPAAAAVAFQNVLGAVGTLNPLAVASAILAAPAVIADGLLNGGYGPDLGAIVSPGLTVKAGGLLSSPGLVFSDDGSFFVNTGGPLAALQQVLQKIATAIAPPAPAPVQVAKTDAAAIPAAAATATVTVPSVPAVSAPDTTQNADPRVEVKPAAGEPSQSAPAASPSVDESSGLAKDSTNTPTSVEAKTDTKTDTTTDTKDVDTTTGNKVEPKTTAGSDATKPAAASTGPAVGHDTTAAPTDAGTTSAGADKGADKGTDSAPKGGAS